LEAQSPKKEYEEVEWKVSNDCEGNEFGRVLKTPIGLGAHDTYAVHSSILTPSVQGDVTPDVASYTKVKAFLQECMDGVGVEDESLLLSALKKYRDDQDKIMNVVILRAKVIETQHELHDEIDAANHILGVVLAAADVGTSRRTGGSNPGRRRRNRDKRRNENQSLSASIHHPSSHPPPKKPRLDHD
jgi:hypothetical protein